MYKRKKHIETKYQFTRDESENEFTAIQYFPTDQMAADINEFFTRIRGRNIQSSYDGSGLYAIGSTLSSC